MNKILLIIRREYLTRVRKKIFIITTFLTPIGFSLFFVIPLIINKASKESRNIAVIDESGIFKNKLKDKNDLTFIYSDAPYDALKKTYSSLNFSGILHIPADYDMYASSSSIEYYSEEQIGFGVQSAIKDQLTDIVTGIRLEKKGVTNQQIKDLTKDVALKVTVQGTAGEKQANTGIATAIGMVMGFFLYFIRPQ